MSAILGANFMAALLVQVGDTGVSDAARASAQRFVDRTRAVLPPPLVQALEGNVRALVSPEASSCELMRGLADGFEAAFGEGAPRDLDEEGKARYDERKLRSSLSGLKAFRSNRSADEWRRVREKMSWLGDGIRHFVGDPTLKKD